MSRGPSFGNERWGEQGGYSQRSVVDAGFLELTRLGVLEPDDPDVRACTGRTASARTERGPSRPRRGASTFGRCATNPSPVPRCQVPLGDLPKAIDVLGPDQAVELDRSRGPVVIHAVPSRRG